MMDYSVLKNINPKKAAYISAGVLLLIILALVVRKMIRKAKAEKRDEELQEIIEDSIIVPDLTYTEAQYVIMADNLKSYLGDKGLSGGFIGVNQAGVYDVMKMMKKDSDILKLINVFGKHSFRKMFTIGTEEYTLPGAITALMTRGEVKKINKIFEDNGLTYRF